MLEMVKVALPTLVNVAVRGALAVPTPRLPKLMAVELKEKPAAGTETSAVLPPPPQDVEHKVMATQAVASIAAIPQCL
jgi:hypothetical protein